MKVKNLKYHSFNKALVLFIALIFCFTSFAADFYKCICHIEKEQNTEMDCCKNKEVKKEPEKTHDCCKKKEKKTESKKDHECSKCLLKISDIENPISTPIKISESVVNIDFSETASVISENKVVQVYQKWRPPDKSKIFLNISSLRI